jgi:hypothetical protein
MVEPSPVENTSRPVSDLRVDGAVRTPRIVVMALLCGLLAGCFG